MGRKTKEARHEYYLDTKDYQLEREKTRYAENKLIIQLRHKKYYDKNKEKFRKINLQNYYSNYDEYRKIQAIYEKNNRDKRDQIRLRLIHKLAKPFNLNDSEFKETLRAWSEKIRKENPFCFCGNPCKISHHIIFKKIMPELSLNLNNGIALCVPCHKEIHKLNGY